MKPSRSIKKDDTWLKYYINSDYIDQKLINTFTNEDFNLI